MVAAQITNIESLQAWLKDLPHGTVAKRHEARRLAVTIAHRAAMRVLPVFSRRQ